MFTINADHSQHECTSMTCRLHPVTWTEGRQFQTLQTAVTEVRLGLRSNRLHSALSMCLQWFVTCQFVFLCTEHVSFNMPDFQHSSATFEPTGGPTELTSVVQRDPMKRQERGKRVWSWRYFARFVFNSGNLID